MRCYKLFMCRPIVCQNFTICSITVSKNFTISSKNETNKKVTVVKRLFPSDSKESPVVIESKEACEVMKKLNWEFHQMYGPILNPKSSEKPVLQRGVNYRTENLIVDPTPIQGSTKPLNVISNFPLMNTTNLSKSTFLNKANLLREELTSRCMSKPPSVSRILEKTMPEESAKRLQLWKQRMIKELGEEGFKKYHEGEFV